MKTILNAFLLSVASVLLLSGCDKPNGPNDSGDSKIILTVNLTAPAGYGTSELPVMTVTAVNADKELSYSETLDAGEGTVDFEVSSGQYQITATGRYSNTITFTGGSSVDVFGNKTTTVALSEVYKSPLLFKEIYNVSYDYTMNDTYMEIVNNSDEVQYLDQVLIASIIKLFAPTPWVDGSGEMLTKYPLYGVMVAFPGTGAEHPLQPGENVVVANDATTWANAADLTNADWECYVSNAGQADTDYDVPNLDIPYNLENQRRLGAGFFGGGLLLAKLPAGMTPADFVAESGNYMTEPNSEKEVQYLMMPTEYLLDAVEIFDADETTPYHTLLSRDDAGSANVVGWSGRSVRRKVTEVVEGRAYYQDTNNSTDDFLTDQPLTPGVHPSQAD